MVKSAYLSVILIWTTTPLAIQWSSQSGVLLGVTSRMAIGLLTLALLFLFMKQKLTQSIEAYIAYVIAGLGIYFSMALVYWSAQYIPSGWISVIFGLSPVITGLLSIAILQENHFNPLKVIGMTLGFAGLLVIFAGSGEFGAKALWGVGGILISTFTHALSAILLKRVNAPITGLESTFGGLIIAVPLFAITYLLSAEEFSSFTPRVVYSILYLGVVATAIGFSMYYFILKKLNAVSVSLITLITPVCALMLGHQLNDELITYSIILGATLVLVGLALFEFDKFICRILRRSSQRCAAIMSSE